MLKGNHAYFFILNILRLVAMVGVPRILRRIGKGLITINLQAEGELYVVRSVQDVLSLWKSGAEGKIAMVEDAGITTLGPILSKLAGVICTSGGLGSHLAIVTREFSIPALMGTKLETSEDLNRRKVKIQPNNGKEGLLLIE
jgi:phosphohistidine swiveling domain-containing protein